MKKKLVFAAAASALALGAQAGVIALGSTWTTGNNLVAPVLTGESADGFTAATEKGAWMYQLASASDFTAESFGVGQTAIMSFTTTVNAEALSDPLDYRFAMWDEVNGGGASTRMDWGPLTGANVANAGVGDNMGPTAIGSFDASVASDALMPSAVFTNGSVVDVSFSVTKTAANLFDVSFTWDDMTFGTTGLANGTADAMDTISGIGIRINAAAGHVNDFTVSDVSVSVIPEPATLSLVAMVGIGMIAARRYFRE